MIAKFGDDEYAEWSTVVDAPVSPVFDRMTAVSVFGPERVDRADAFVTSHLEYQVTGIQDLITANRAGDGEATLGLDGIRDKYRDPGRRDRIKASNRLVDVSDLVFIHDPHAPGPYLLKSRTTVGGFVSEGELNRLIDISETVLEMRRSASSWQPTDPEIVKDERGLLADASR